MHALLPAIEQQSIRLMHARVIISGLSCTNDYNRNITCIWNCSDACTGGSKAACSVHAQRIKSVRIYKSWCLLKPVDVSAPSSLQTCSLIFHKDGIFSSYHELKVWINCSQVVMTYRPVCHVKLPPPGKPHINRTTISWEAKHAWMSTFQFQLEWKLAHERWNGASVHREIKSHNQSELSLIQLLRGAKYEARVRVSAKVDLSNVEWHWSDWSNWSTTALWTSYVGEVAVQPPNTKSYSLWLVLGLMVSGTAFAAFLALLVFSTGKTTWVYAFKKIRGPLLPDPGKSFLQNKWASPPFSKESLQSFLGPVDILPVKSIDCVELETPGNLFYPEGLREKTITKTTRDSFFTSRSSQQWQSPPPLASLTLGNLKQCAPDSPYAAVGALAKQDGEMNNIRNLLEPLGMFSNGSNEATLVISDYEKIAKLQNQPLGEDEESESKHGGEVRSLFGEIFIEGSIQLSLDYEYIQTVLPLADGTELPSADSGIGSAGEEHRSPEESMEKIEIEATDQKVPHHARRVSPQVQHSEAIHWWKEREGGREEGRGRLSIKSTEQNKH
ncbi:uncharacterized protein LOC130920761 isoform X2 [Corythoichthys intestinalis]|uniref:uncharacterized protein LOC130920761 isoform X2 n=1 Tax=Corythoichthys intestinalis TaxID=161448 RepID=UPI0025A5CF6A|nr:uncharacterized protein LOC130920761 isoform X2 [Corythoichthys intestinalis]